MTDLRKAAEMALACLDKAIAYSKDEMKDQEMARIALRQALAQPEQELVGSPCPEFWDWLPKAYNFNGDGAFTKYNMEVAFLAGQQSVTQQPPIAFMGTDFEGNPTKFSLNPFSGSLPLYTAPPKREWGDLTDKEIADARDFVGFSSEIAEEIHYFARHLETKLKEKNT